MKLLYRKICNLIDRRLLIFSGVMGFISSWMIRDTFTQWLMSGKSFAGRNAFIKIAVLGFLLVCFSVIIYALFYLINCLLKRLGKTSKQNNIIGDYAIRIIAVVMAIFSIYFAISYASQPLLEAHGFRQTQTAMTSYWMIREGWKLAYETPVVGYPWSIPFEFPVYQSLVALIAWAIKLPLDPVGRLVSFGFLLACAWPIHKIFKRAGLPPDTAWLMDALLWSSPLYIFWGRAFMIETAAVFFTLAAIPYLFDLISERPAWKPVLLFSFWATLGVLQKSTTAVPVMLILAIAVLIDHLNKNKLKLPSFRKIACVLVAFFLPVMVGMIWTHYADLVKAHNIVGYHLTSTEVAKWMPGSMEQRLDPQVWKTILWDRVLLQNGAGIFGIAVFIAAFIWGDLKTRKLVSVCLGLFIFPLIILTNVHFIHDYYQTSSTIFLLGGLAISIVAISSRTVHKDLVIFIFTLIFITSNLVSFFFGYEKTLTRVINPSTQLLLSLTDAVDRYTPEKSAIVIFGKDWSGEIGYYSKRKCFTVPDEQFDVVWLDPEAYLGDIKLGAMIDCMNEPHPPSLEDFIQRPEIQAHPYVYQFGGCYLWMPDVDGELKTIRNERLSSIIR